MLRNHYPAVAKYVADKAFDQYDAARKNEFSELRAWDICHYQFQQAINNPNQSSVNRDLLALHLGMYLANWGMYRGSAFIREFNYRVYDAHFDDEYSVIDIILDPAYKLLLDIVLSDLNANIKPLQCLYKRLEDAFNRIKGRSTQKQVQSISATLVTKTILATFGCIPAYDTNFYTGIVRGKIATGSINKNNIGKCVSELADFYSQNSQTLECKRKQMTLLEPPMNNILYPQAKILDMGFFDIGLNIDTVGVKQLPGYK